MFTPRSISEVFKGMLKTMALFAVMIAVRSPATVKNLVQPFCHYVASFISEATDENAGKRVTKTQLDRGSAQSRPVIDLDSLNLPTQQTKAPSGPTTSTSQETSEDPSNSNATTVQPQATNLSNDPIKFKSAEFNDRFHAGIIVPAASPKPIVDVPVSLTRNECENTIHQLAALHESGKWVDGLKQSDDFLQALDRTPDAYPEYRVLAAGLAFRMAAMIGNPEKAEHFGKLAMKLSRQFENYKLEEIEGSYYQVAGREFDFAKLVDAMKSMRTDFAGLALEEAITRSEALVAACGSLPDTSVFRLQADLFEATAKRKRDNDLFNDLRRFASIQSRAESVGNHVIEDTCKPIVTGLFEQIQGAARAISSGVPSKPN